MTSDVETFLLLDKFIEQSDEENRITKGYTRTCRSDVTEMLLCPVLTNPSIANTQY